LPPVTAARLARGMAEALEAAHAKGIVHRDLKPENVFVQAQPPDSVKLVDFGIAKLAGELRAGQVHQTRSGALMGTPLYMSPEQCRDSANLDSRTDLYSLGCVLYEMLTGHPPFTHANLGDLVVAHMTETPKDARAVNPAVPPALADLTADLLRKNPSDRPPGMRAVADRLAAFVGGLTTVPEAPARGPVTERPPTKSKTTFGDSAAELVDGVPARKRRSMTLVIAAVLGLGAGGVAVTRLRTPQSAGAAPATEAASSVAAAAAAAPAPSPASAPTPPPAASPPRGGSPGPGSASTPAPREDSRKKGHHHGVEVASARAPTPDTTSPPLAASAPVSADTPAAAPTDLSGTWEGPWEDPEHHQKGRLYLQVAGGGGANGWLSNATAARSYRLVGRAERPGEYVLACQCPANQAFSARVTLHPTEGGELRGRVSLSATTGVFGQSHVSLRRSAPR
jgi:serine/threonine-protein kinase